MLRPLSCCCCVSTENSEHNERQPLLQPTTSDLNGPGSARQIQPARDAAQTVRRSGRLALRRVDVPELDRRFSDVSETFNEQQQHYEAMVRHIRSLRQSWDCAQDDSLAFAACVRKIREEHQARYKVSLMMSGYDFSLSVAPVGSEPEEEPLPPGLRRAQEELRATSESARATISRGTVLQELLGWFLRSKDQMAEQVKGAAPSYQEQGRLSENLEENMKEVRRAKELSMAYRQRAGEVLTEAAQIAGPPLDYAHSKTQSTF